MLGRHQTIQSRWLLFKVLEVKCQTALNRSSKVYLILWEPFNWHVSNLVHRNLRKRLTPFDLKKIWTQHLVLLCQYWHIWWGWGGFNVFLEFFFFVSKNKIFSVLFVFFGLCIICCDIFLFVNLYVYYCFLVWTMSTGTCTIILTICETMRIITNILESKIYWMVLY